MKFKFFYLVNIRINIMIVIIFILLIIKIYSKKYLSFIYPYSLVLSNNNIFVIHKTGISICNSDLSTILENITYFNGSDEITETSLSKVTTVFEEDYIISIINIKIYIFDEIGNFLYNSSDIILEEGETAEYYTLATIDKTTEFYHYIIGYVHNNLFYFLNYKYYFSNKKNVLLFSKKNLYYHGNINQYYLYTRALTCQYILDNSFDYVLVCISTINSYIVFQYYLVGETDIIKSTKYTSIGYSFPEILCIKSVRKKDKTKMLVSLYLSTDEARFFIFDFNLGSVLTNKYFIDQHCRLEYYGLKINYYKEKDEYILSCIDYNGKILV